ncbi:hypothetical protein RRF57_007764 [Xylaria bambusicola]|uniref:Uncharacterized protein n=1 Tax=Xylaria bambusicola TaxID=326684 RepID=A0AAN7UGP9_9PEZI
MLREMRQVSGKECGHGNNKTKVGVQSANSRRARQAAERPRAFDALRSAICRGATVARHSGGRELGMVVGGNDKVADCVRVGM